jgi:hypothetical protein
MNLAKALKEKNRLAAEVAQLTERLKAQNSRATGQAFDYDAHEVLRDLRATTERLVELKAGIAKANAEIYGKIFRLAELKGLAATLNGLETREGTFREGGGYGQPTVEVTYRAQLKQVEVDALLTEIEAEAATLQDELDAFNVTRTLTA